MLRLWIRLLPIASQTAVTCNDEYALLEFRFGLLLHVVLKIRGLPGHALFTAEPMLLM